MHPLSRENEESRREERVKAVLPVALQGRSGTTRDVSASGVFIETDVTLSLGSTLTFEIAIETGSGPMVLACTGEVRRVERRGERLGIAVSILESMVRSA